MIWAFLTGRGFLGLAKGVWLLGAAVALIGAVWWLKSAEDADDRANQEIGATKAINEGHETTLKQTGAANDAGNEVRSGAGNAKFDECVRSAAQGFAGHCERYRNNEPVPD